MTDHRCPYCDIPVTGLRVVTTEEPKVPKEYCPHCNKSIELTSRQDNEIGLIHYYTLTGDNE